MDHAALYRAGTDDGDLDHQVVEGARLHARQHGHLRAALDLEHADGVGAADHPVGLGVFGGNVLQLERLAAPAGGEVERAAYDCQHAQREDVDLQQAQRVEVVLVPLHHAAVGHRGVLDRHQARQLAARDDEAAWMLRQVPRKTHQLFGHRAPLLRQRGFRVQPALGEAGREAGLAVPPAMRLGDLVDHAGIHAQRLADVAQHAARPVADHHAGQRSAQPAVLVIDVLDHLLAFAGARSRRRCPAARCVPSR